MLVGLCLVLSLAGCSLFPTKPTTNSGTAASVVTILGGIQTSVTDLKTSQNALISSWDTLKTHDTEVDQFVADRLAEAMYVNLNNPQQNSVTSLVQNTLQPAATAIGIQPSATVKDAAIKDLQLALSGAQNDALTLKTKNDALLVQAGQLAQATSTLTQQVQAKEVALSTATQAVDAKTGQLAQASAQVTINANEANTARLQAAQEAAAKVRLATARWFMLAGGILFALGLVGLFIHIPDAWIASATGVCLLATGWGVSYVEDLLQQSWFRYLLDGLVVAGIGSLVWFVIRALEHRKGTITTSTGFQNLVGALQEAANKNPALASELQPFLQQWNVTATGAPDNAVIAAINQTATKLNVTNPGQTSTATGVTVPVVSARASTPVVAPVTTPVPTITPTTTAVPTVSPATTTSTTTH